MIVVPLLLKLSSGNSSHLSSSATRGGANGQLPISFGDSPIVIFINSFLPIEIFVFHDFLFIFIKIVIVLFPPVGIQDALSM
jgi:hypothetical protein